MLLFSLFDDLGRRDTVLSPSKLFATKSGSASHSAHTELGSTVKLDDAAEEDWIGNAKHPLRH